MNERAGWFKRRMANLRLGDGSISIRSAVVDQALVSAGVFAFTIVLVRIMGVDAYGAWTLVWGAVQLCVAIQGSLFLAPFQSLGHSLQTRYGAEYAYALFGQQQAFAVVAAICLSIGLSFFASPSRHGLLPFQLAVGVSTYFLLTQEYFRRIQLAKGRATFAIMGDVFRYVGAPILLLGMTANWTVALGDVFLMVSATCMLTILLNLKSYGFLRGHCRAVSREVLRAHWPFVRWLTPSIAFQWINANVVFYAVGWAYGEGPVGELRMAQLLSVLFLLLLEALENVVPAQAVMRLKNGGRAGTERYIVGIGAWMCVAFAMFLAVILPWTDFWLKLLFGGKAASIDLHLVWMFCLVSALMVPTYCFNVLHRSTGTTRSVFIGDSLASIASVLGALTIAWQGYYAAILTMLVAQAVRLAVLVWLYRYAHFNAVP